MTVSVDALNTSIYSQYIAQLFPHNAQVLGYPDYSGYYSPHPYMYEGYAAHCNTIVLKLGTTE